MTRVIIAGGGVIGLSLGYELTSRGVEVTILDRGPMGREASWAGAGILTPGNAHPPDPESQDPLDHLRGLSDPLLEEWSARLREETGVDNGYRRCGALYLALGDHEEQCLETRYRTRWVPNGIPARSLDGNGARFLEPQLSRGVTRGYHLPDEAQVRNPRHLRALMAALASRRARLESGRPVTGFVTEGDRVRGVRTPSGPVEGDAVVVAAGPWSGGLLATLGLERLAPEPPVRGQIVLLSGDSPLLARVLWRGPRYVVPRPDGRVLLGSTMESEGFACHPTGDGVRELLAFGTELVPALGDLRFESAWAGLRPGSSNGYPKIGSVDRRPGLYLATGHLRGGLELSTGTAVVVADQILG